MFRSQKRKLCLEEAEHKKADKMFKLSETVVEMSDMKETNDILSLTEGRKRNFKTTDKKKRSNLLKAASRIHFNVETNQKSNNLRFSA